MRRTYPLFEYNSVAAIDGEFAGQPKGHPMNAPSNHSEARKFSPNLFRRRHFLIDRRRQLAATVRIAGLVMVLLITINVLIAWQSYATTDKIMARNPMLGEIMRANDLRNLAIMVGFSLIIFSMVVVRSVMYTHRTAGAVFHIVRTMERIEAGEVDVTLRLRGDDSLRDLVDPFNRMVKALLQLSDEDKRSMTGLADEIEEPGSPEGTEKL